MPDRWENMPQKSPVARAGRALVGITQAVEALGIDTAISALMTEGGVEKPRINPALLFHLQEAARLLDMYQAFNPKERISDAFDPEAQLVVWRVFGKENWDTIERLTDEQKAALVEEMRLLWQKWAGNSVKRAPIQLDRFATMFLNGLSIQDVAQEVGSDRDLAAGGLRTLIDVLCRAPMEERNAALRSVIAVGVPAATASGERVTKISPDEWLKRALPDVAGALKQRYAEDDVNLQRAADTLLSPDTQNFSEGHQEIINGLLQEVGIVEGQSPAERARAMASLPDTLRAYRLNDNQIKTLGALLGLQVVVRDNDVMVDGQCDPLPLIRIAEARHLPGVQLQLCQAVVLFLKGTALARQS